jgi:hypothetical protein
MLADGAVITYVRCLKCADTIAITLDYVDPIDTRYRVCEQTPCAKQEPAHPIGCLRHAASLGFCIGGTGTPGINPKGFGLPQVHQHVCGYDIEQVCTPVYSLRNVGVIAASAWCTCGKSVIASCYNNDSGDVVPSVLTPWGHVADMVVIKCDNPIDPYAQVLDWVRDHQPHVMVAHNGYNYDNQVAACSLPRVSHRRYYKLSLVGGMAGTYLEIGDDTDPGTLCLDSL